MIEITLPDPVEIFTPAFIILILIELFYARRSLNVRMEPRDTATSLLMGFGSQIEKLLIGFIAFGAYVWAYQFRVFEVPFEWWAWPLCFMLDDLAYYAYHRAGHRVRWFWAAHVNHHTSQHYNLTTALRQTWTGVLSGAWAFRLPLFLLGFHPAMVLFCIGLNLIYQFWIHTEAIDRLPLWFEAVMNTPSHHRVHHATNPQYLDSNYAGVFIIWDRMFGTFVAEDAKDPPRYGIIRNLGTYNILKVAFHEWIALAKDVATANTLGDALRYVIRPPGWTPDGSRQTTEMIKADWRAREAKTRLPRLPAE